LLEIDRPDFENLKILDFRRTRKAWVGRNGLAPAHIIRAIIALGRVPARRRRFLTGTDKTRAAHRTRRSLEFFHADQAHRGLESQHAIDLQQM